MDKQELKNLSAVELETKANEIRRDLCTLRLKAASAQVKDYSQMKKLRRSLARTLTFMHQKTTQNKQEQ